MSEINTLQTNIMIFAKGWANCKKTPVPQKEIIIAMKGIGVKSYTAVNAINALLTKGFIRRAVSPQANKTFYVLIRNITTPE